VVLYSSLATKLQDELKVLQLCRSKAKAKKLPMEVIDAEYQWYDRLILSPALNDAYVG
jgi:cell fate regulator YaaT (PSP1 superfamily)